MKHYIIVKFKEDVNWKNLVDEIRELFEKALELDGVSDVCVKVSNSELSNRYDIMIEIECTEKGLINYDNSEMHKFWKLNYGEFIQSKAIFDCDI